MDLDGTDVCQVRPRALIGCGGVDRAWLEDAGFEAVKVSGPDAFRAANLEAEASGNLYALCVMPDGPGEWLDILVEAHRINPMTRFILEESGQTRRRVPLPDSLYMHFKSPLGPELVLPLARHLSALWREGLRKGDWSARSLPTANGDTRRLETLYAIIEKLHGERSFEAGLSAALAEIAGFLKAKTASLMVFEDSRTLRVLEAVGPNRLKILGQLTPLSESRVAKHAIAGQEPIFITDMRDDSRFGESSSEMRYRSRSVLSVPIFSKDGPMAVVNMGGDEDSVTFTERDRDLIVTLSRQIAIALEKNRLLEHLKTAVSGSIRALANAIEAKDPYTKGHSERVTHFAVLTAAAMGLSGDELEILKQASILHDVGKIGIPGGVLHKPGMLDEIEYKMIQRHPEIGISIVRQIGAMDQTLPIIISHHERFDGFGYPNGLGGEDIPLGARIVAVGDAFDAMTSNRPYRSGLSIEKAVSEIIHCSGTQFDRRVAEAFADNIYLWPLMPEAESEKAII